MKRVPIDEELLAAYLRGELDSRKAAAVEAWYDASEENRRHLGEIHYLLHISDSLAAAEAVDTGRAWRRCRTRMHAARRRSLLRRIVRTAAAAAAVLLLLAGGAVAHTLSRRWAQPIEITTRLGERSQAVLPDGTKVWLNSCSRLTYRAPLFSSKRRVEMDGEAYFEVAHDRFAPFVVSAGGLDVRVLGTRFNIRSEAGERQVTTVLLEGAVEASAEDRHLRLSPGQRLVYDAATGAMHLEPCPSAERAIGWISGRIYFDRSSFAEIAAEIERYFNVEFLFRDEALLDERFSGEFRVEDGIYHILSVLQLTDKFTYAIAGDRIEISAR